MVIDIPKMNGIETTRQIKCNFPEVLIIGITVHEESTIVDEICQAGASACLLKGGEAELLVCTIRNLINKPSLKIA